MALPTFFYYILASSTFCARHALRYLLTHRSHSPRYLLVNRPPSGPTCLTLQLLDCGTLDDTHIGSSQR
jgi:hypothetical protein